MNHADLIGVKYTAGGMSPEEGFDCRTLVAWWLRERLGVDLPPHPFWDQLDLETADGSFDGFTDLREVLEEVPCGDLERPQLGWILELPRIGRGKLRHLAVAVEERPGRYLSTRLGSGVFVAAAHKFVAPLRVWRVKP